MAKQTGTFNRNGNNGTAVCAECGRRRQRANMANEMCCVDCYEIAGLENEHLDGGHEDAIVVDCPMCREDAAELKIELPAAAPEMSPVAAIKARIEELNREYRAAEYSGDEETKNRASAEYNVLIEELEDAAAEMESDHLLGEHGPGAEQPECPVCKEYSKREAEMAAAQRAEMRAEYAKEGIDLSELHGAMFGDTDSAARLNELVTEEYCFICNRLTDHRGEHELADLDPARAALERIDREWLLPAEERDAIAELVDGEPPVLNPGLADREPWAGGFAANH